MARRGGEKLLFVIRGEEIERKKPVEVVGHHAEIGVSVDREMEALAGQIKCFHRATGFVRRGDQERFEHRLPHSFLAFGRFDDGLNLRSGYRVGDGKVARDRVLDNFAAADEIG